VVDNSKSLADVFVGREIMLNVGRLCGALFGFIVLSFADFPLLLLSQGAFLLAYPLILELKRKKLASI
jgi:hypothetical protein